MRSLPAEISNRLPATNLAVAEQIAPARRSHAPISRAMKPQFHLLRCHVMHHIVACHRDTTTFSRHLCSC